MSNPICHHPSKPTTLLNGVAQMRHAIGSIISGTLRTADLLRAFASELECSNAAKYDYFVRLAYASADQIDIDADQDDEAAQELIADLCCELSKLAPAGYYFGAHI